MGKPRGRPPKDSKTTNAERCKAYRSKHQETYNADDALRKRLSREQMKLKPAENRLRLQRQAQLQRKSKDKLLSKYGLNAYFSD